MRPSATSTQILTTQFFFGELWSYPGLGVNAAVYLYISPHAACGAPQATNQSDGLFNQNLVMVTALPPSGAFGLWAGFIVAL